MTNRPAWCVRAIICGDCKRVSIAIYPTDVITDEAWEAHCNGATINGDDPDEETSLSGDDWRPLATRAATELTGRTGRLISDSCISVYTDDEDQNEAIFKEAREILQALMATRLGAVAQTTKEESQKIVARYEELCELAEEAGISNREREQREEAALDFAASTPRHARVIFEDYARKNPDGPPADSEVTEQERQKIIELIVRPYQRRRN